MNKIIFSLVLLTFLLIGTGVASAYSHPYSDLVVTKQAERMEKKNEVQLQRKEATLEGLKNKANKEIDRRIESLQQLIEKITGIKNLSDEQKSSLTSQVQTEIANLTALKDKINAATDLQTLRNDVKSLVTSHRIYALYIPKIHIMVAADRALSLADDMDTLASKLETKINEAQSQGKDVSALQSALTTMKGKTADSRTKAKLAITLVSSLTPEGFPANKTTLKDAREQLRLAHLDLVQARKSAKEIMQGLHKMGLMKAASEKPREVKREK